MNTKSNCIRTEKTDTVLRPYEKCLTLGAETLSDAELLAVILRTGVSGMNSIELAQHIFSVCCRSKGLLGLSSITIPELLKIRGVGKVKAVQIKCICELSRRTAKQSASAKLKFTEPEAIAAYYMQDLRLLEKEHMILVLLEVSQLSHPSSDQHFLRTAGHSSTLFEEKVASGALDGALGRLSEV